MPSPGFEPAITATERPEIYPSDRTATGVGVLCYFSVEIILKERCYLQEYWSGKS